MKIGIVGPCAAGKSTLAARLARLGYDAHDCAQEHSEVQTMWQRICRPELLLYLDASLPTIRARLNVHWDQAYLDELNRRLTHAREHADMYLDTNGLAVDEVLARIVAFLESRAQRGSG